jgi:hypothetical protein
MGTELTILMKFCKPGFDLSLYFIFIISHDLLLNSFFESLLCLKLLSFMSNKNRHHLGHYNLATLKLCLILCFEVFLAFDTFDIVLVIQFLAPFLPFVIRVFRWVGGHHVFDNIRIP